VNNCCVSTYVNILCAKYYENRFVKKLQRNKTESVVSEHGVETHVDGMLEREKWYSRELSEVLE